MIGSVLRFFVRFAIAAILLFIGIVAVLMVSYGQLTLDLRQFFCWMFPQC